MYYLVDLHLNAAIYHSNGWKNKIYDRKAKVHKTTE